MALVSFLVTVASQAWAESPAGDWQAPAAEFAEAEPMPPAEAANEAKATAEQAKSDAQEAKADAKKAKRTAEENKKTVAELLASKFEVGLSIGPRWLVDSKARQRLRGASIDPTGALRVARVEDRTDMVISLVVGAFPFRSEDKESFWSWRYIGFIANLDHSEVWRAIGGYLV